MVGGERVIAREGKMTKLEVVGWPGAGQIYERTALSCPSSGPARCQWHRRTVGRRDL